MKDLELIKITKDYEKEIMDMLKEVTKIDATMPWQYAGMASLESFASFDDWLEKIEKESKGEDLLQNRVPATTYTLIRHSDNKLLGIYNIRHSLNEFLLNFAGHIGYSIIPSERKKGYGTEGLKLALQEAKKIGINKVLITSNVNNIASSKVIENCNGVLENIVTKNNQKLKRYWINI